MDPKYFERLHQAEARQAEWRMLDQALQKTARTGRSLRVVVGRWLILIGARLAGEPVLWPVETTKAPVLRRERSDAYRYN